MDKLLPTLGIAVVVVLVFLGMRAGWRRRARRDAGLAPLGALVAPGPAIAEADAFYVATTRHDAPLDRVVVPGLGFRSRATIAVSTGGVVIEARGEPPVAIPAASAVAIGAATWTIDRTVEPDGLVLLQWRAPNEETLDTYLRVVDPAQRRPLVSGIRTIIPPQAGTGTKTTIGSEA